MTERTAVEVRNDHENGRITIKWNDGARLQYFYDDLRNACPCAVCCGHTPGEVEPPQVSGVTVTYIHGVGHYALRFDFSDGHNTGLYDWPLLYRLGQPMTA